MTEEEDKFDKNFIKRVKDFEFQCANLLDFFENNNKSNDNKERERREEGKRLTKEVLEEYRRQRRRFGLEPQPMPEGMKLGDGCRAKVGRRWIRAQLWSRTESGHHVVFLPDDTTVLVERVKPLQKKQTVTQDLNEVVVKPWRDPIAKAPLTKAPPKRPDAAIANAQKRSWKEMQQKLSKK